MNHKFATMVNSRLESGKNSICSAAKLFLVFIICCNLNAGAQQIQEVAGKPMLSQNIGSNFFSFSKKSLHNSNESKLNNKGFENHPELGVLTANAPCANCYELLEKRNEFQKYFVEEGSNKSKFVIQAGARPLHFKDDLGIWRTVSEKLEADEYTKGVFLTKGREVNSKIDVHQGFSTLSSGYGSIAYNRNLELIYVKPDGTEQTLGLANWNNFSAGDDGVKVTEIWSGIDMEVSVLYTGMKTNFIIKNALAAYAGGKLLIRDHIQLGSGLKMSVASKQIHSGAISFNDKNGNAVFLMQQAIAYEKNDVKNTVQNLNYNLGVSEELNIEIPGSMLNKPTTSYPIVIDPLVTGTTAVGGFTYSSTFATSCITTVNVTIPAAATISDVKTTYEFTGTSPALWSNAQVAMTMNGGCSYTIPSCGAVTAIGLCGLVNASEWSTGANWGSSACVPAFSCSSYVLPFTISTSQNYLTTAACASTYFASASNFTVNINGSVATLPTITPSGPSTLCMPSTLTLTGSPSGGSWASSVTTVANVTGGVVTGSTNGTTNISYTSGGCTTVNVVTVGTAPAITGVSSICFTGSPGDTTDLTGTPTGGTWTSSLITVATVTATNPTRVTAVGTGTTIVSYSTGVCYDTAHVDVSNATAVAPASQPTGLTFSGTTTTGTTVGFTTTTAEGYLVIASTSPTLSATPVNDTMYLTGASFGGGKVINGSAYGTSPSYTTSILNSNTHYYVFVFAFNMSCAGPQYNVVSPLSGSFTTCIQAPTSLTTGSAGVNTIALSWTASLTGGGYTSPISYIVSAYTDATLTTLVTGYPVSVGSGTSYTASGLLGATQYWFTVKPVDACGLVSNIATGTTSCAGSATIPYLETFNISPIAGDRVPDCMGSNVANCIASGVQNSVSYGGFNINADHTTGAGGYFYNFPYNSYCGGTWAHQWLLTPGLTLTAGTTYTLRFWYRISGGVSWTSLKAQFSSNGTVPAATSAVMAGTPTTIGALVAPVSTTTWASYQGTFSPASSGTFYVGIDANSITTATTFLAIDDIEICAVPSSITASNATSPYCAPATINLSTSGGTNVTAYSWTGPAGYSSSAANPVLTNTATGTFVYSVTGYNDPPSFGFGGICSVSATTTLTVNPTPNPLTGLDSVCVGSNLSVGETSVGGTWSITPTTVATVSGTGSVHGVSGGVATVSYSFAAGSCSATKIITVDPGIPTFTPASGGVIPTRCAGINSSLSYTSTNSPSSYSLTWAGGPYAFLPNVPAGTPLPPGSITIVDLSGVSTGTYTGTLVVSNACGSATSIVTFNIVNTPPPITGSVSICVGNCSTLADAGSGGAWFSSNTSVATVGLLTGVVCGAGSGTATISYSIGVGCAVTTIATVNITPVAITGPTVICLGGTGTLTDATTGGSWSSSNTAVATVSSLTATTEQVNGLSAGTATITYQLGSCMALYPITVAPAAITGTGAICVGNTLDLSDLIGGGTWTSTATGIATVNAVTGVVGGVSSGTATISYTVGACSTTTDVTVNVTPTPITGTDSVCQYSTTTLSETVGGGSWTSGTPGVATVSGTGVVSGLTPGTSVIVYSVSPSPCTASVTVTVNLAPAAIGGTLSVCAGSTTALTETTGGGTWSSSATAIATVNTTGVVAGISPGVTTITDSIGHCAASASVTVNIAPAPIGGTATVCVGSVTTLTEAVSGGSWHSATAGVATVDAVGDVTGVSQGTSVITDSIGNCVTSKIVTVNALPAAIGGNAPMCLGAGTITLTNTSTGGSWSTTGAIVSVNAATGVVTALGLGTQAVTYSNGCTPDATAIVTVTTTPAAITGTLNVCVGSTTSLADAISFGTWTSSATGVASVDPVTGVVTGVSQGTATINYNTGCAPSASAIVTVHAAPAAIGGNVPMCIGGGTITLTNTSTGGNWTTTGSLISVGLTTGVVTITGGSGGTQIVTYSNGCGTDAYATITVNSTPLPIVGNVPLCACGSTLTLTDGTAGGTWSGGGVIASIGGTTGIVTSTCTQGTATISYSSAGCATPSTVILTVNSAPAAIGGDVPMCLGAGTITLTNTSTGGTWSTTGSVCSVNPTTGVVSALGLGTQVVTYSNGCGTDAYATITVNATPTSISGNVPICACGSTITLTDGSSGGTWSGGGIVASVAGATGVVTSTCTQGTGTIIYTVPGCVATASVVVTVNSAPAPIGGNVPICVGGTLTLTETSLGGTWSTSGSVCSINPATHVVTGETVGTQVVTYDNGCGTPAYATITVNASPTSISGSVALCACGSTITLTDGSSGGTWSGGGLEATVGATTGIVTSTCTQGTSTITYTVPGCASTATVIITVNSTPAAIGGNVPMCEGGSSITLTNTSTGGSWSLSATTIATINSSTGVVTPSTSSWGTATVTYDNGCGTPATATITVNAAPAAISGNAPLCACGSTLTLTDGSTGGTWSGGGLEATVGSATGIVTSTCTQGTATINYTTGCGSPVSVTITVNSTPAPIGGNVPMCEGGSGITLTNTSTGGTWSLGVTTIATINPATGVVTPSSTSSGTVIATYDNGCGTAATTIITVNAAATAISGNAPLCACGSTLTLTDGSSGGTWSGGGLEATVGASSGIVTSTCTQGTATITYTVPGCASTATVVVTVNSSPASIGGNVPMCECGTGITLTNTSTGGTWSLSATTIASINPTTGVITPSCTSWGTATVTYSNGCGTPATATITVNASPTSISGNVPLCACGSTITLTDGSTGGTWSGGGVIASVGATTGIVTPSCTEGTATVSYSTGCGADVSVIITINAAPAAIAGSTTLCVGSTSALTNTSTGGTWTSSATSIASVDPATGIVTGVGQGTAVIDYANGCGSAATVTVTVHAIPTAISGNTPLCACGSILTLTDAATGGTWSASSGVVTIVPTSGVVTSSCTQGTVNITFSNGCGSPATTIVTVNSAPASITGTPTVCVGATTVLANTSTGGTWSSSATTIASVDAITGVVSGNNQGTAIVTYSNGCSSPATLVVTVNALPAAITGNVPMCASGSNITLSDASTGGSWSSSAPTIAGVGALTGIVSPGTQGTATITFSNGCLPNAMVTVSVNSAPAPIAGNAPMCAGVGTETLTNTSTGGTWSGGASGVCSVNAATGVVAALAPGGTATISYSNGCGTAATVVVTVNSSPAPITGNTPQCVGSTLTLSDATTGGTWAGGSAPIAFSVGVGIYHCNGQGTVAITYSNGCTPSATAIITVMAAPSPITGNVPMCAGGSTITLLESAIGGTWSGGATGIASINPTTGVVTSGTVTGTATFTYSNGCGTAAHTVVTVNPLPAPPAAITGILHVCVGQSTSLSDATAGGTWSSAHTAIATINPAGVATGMSAGIDSIIYTEGSVGCGAQHAYAVLTVYPLPNAGVISGPVSICNGNIGTLTDTASGGTWSNVFTTISTIVGTGGTGIVTTHHIGVDTIKYTVPSTLGCPSSVAIRVEYVDTTPTMPAPIAGLDSVCQGQTITLTDDSTGHVWSSSDTSIAKINSVTGIVTGMSGGVVTITYNNVNGCDSTHFVTYTVTVKPLPATPSAIMGNPKLCVGGTTSLTDSTAGGIWSSNSGVVIVDLFGNVTADSVGHSVISYTVFNACGNISVTDTVTVYPTPHVSAITGTVGAPCTGTTVTLSDSVSGGYWSTSSASIATVNPTGVVSFIASGSVFVYYIDSNYCGADTARDSISVLTTPVVDTIIGPSIICSGGGLHLYTDSISGGTWGTIPTFSPILTIDASSGMASTSALSGIVTIIYFVSTSVCGTASITKVVTVNPAPLSGTIIASVDTVCAGGTLTLTDAATGGLWSASNSSASVDSMGVVTGNSGGTDTIRYTVTNYCGTSVATLIITVHPLPVAGTIIGPNHACIGQYDTVHATAAGGVWSMTTTHAAIGATGAVHGISAGLDTIHYVVTNGCGTALATLPITVSPLPHAGIITGHDSICIGSVDTLIDTTSGGIWQSIYGHSTVAAGFVTGVTGGWDSIVYMVTNLCGTDTAWHKVFVVAPLSPGMISGLTSVCQYTTITLTETSTSGTWSSLDTNATVSATGVVTGKYAGLDTIKYSVNNLCGTFATTYPIIVNPAPNAGVIKNINPFLADTSVCIGSTITIHDTITGGAWHISNGNANFSFSSGVVHGLVIGLDTIIYTKSNICGIDTAWDIIHIFPLPSLPAITGPHALCLGMDSSLNIFYFGGHYTSGNPSIASVDSIGRIITLAPGMDTIKYTTTDGHGCMNSTLFRLNVLDTADFKISNSITNDLCFDDKLGKIDLTLTPDTAGRNIGPFKYRWSNGDSTQNISALAAGTYTVRVTETSTKCYRNDTFVVTQQDSVLVSIKVKQDTCRTDNGAIWLSVSGGVPPYSYEWSNNSTDTFILNSPATTYTVTVSDSNKCKQVIAIQIGEGPCDDILVYNGFSPNGDGNNDLWVIKNLDLYKDNSVQVFDKWGDVVYEKSSYQNDWNGRDKNGKLVPAGTYFYIVKLNAVNNSGASNVKTGYLLIK